MVPERHESLRAARQLHERAEAVAVAVVALQRERKLVPHQHTRDHLRYLEQAVAVDSPMLFVRYVEWARGMLESRGTPAADLAMNLRCLVDVLARETWTEPVIAIVEAALPVLGGLARGLPSHLGDDDPHVELAREYLNQLLSADRRRASRLILDAVATGTSIRDIYMHVFQPAQRELGRLWQLNQISVAKEHYCTAATQLIMSQLYPQLFAESKSGRRMVATCVGGELHELGVRMVADLFELDGWDTVYLGANTPTPGVLAAISEHQPLLLAVSATLTVHVGHVRELIAAVRADAGAAEITIMVGGYCFNLDPELYREFGADACCVDADAAVVTANALFEAP